MSNSFIIEHGSDHSVWYTYVWIAGIHDGGEEHLRHGTEETHSTLDDAVRRIKAWQHVERLIAKGLPTPKPEDIVLWEDFGEYHVETHQGQRTLTSFSSALAMASYEVNVRNYLN
jgi:hypothetical protein